MRPRNTRLRLVGLALGLAAVFAALDVPGVDAAESRRKAVLAALKEKDDRERAQALERALSGADSAAVAKLVLGPVLSKIEAHVEMDIAARVLGRMRSPDAVEVIADAATSRGELQKRVVAIEALGRSSADTGAFPLLELVADEDPRLRTCALAALARRGDAQHVSILEQALSDPSERVRSAAAWGLVGLEAKDAVPALAGALRAQEGRFVDDFAAVLRRLTGQSFGPAPERYEAWWREQNGQDPVDGVTEIWSPPPVAVSSPLFEVRTKSILFVLSTGESMKDDVRPRELSGNAQDAFASAGDDLLEEYAEAKTKLDLARVHLRLLLRGLADGTRFDVISYAASPTFAFGQPTVADDRSRRQAESRISGLSPGGGGNLHGALVRAFDPKGKDPLGGPAPFDTVVIIGDGRLAAPGVTERVEVMAAIQRWRRVHQVRFLAVALFPADDSIMGTLAGGPPHGALVSLP